MLKHIQSHFYVVTQTHTYRDTEKDTSTDAETYTKKRTHLDRHTETLYTNKQNTKTNVSVIRLDASILTTYRPTEYEKDSQNSNC